MKTLKAAIESKKCRKGEATGTTKRGAYWLACPPISIRQCGGDGIGNNAANVTFTLELRHYRSGEVQASIHRDAWHQNGSYSGAGDRWATANELLECVTVESVIVALKGHRFERGSDWEEAVYGDRFEELLTKELVALGMVASEPAPDEATA